MRWSCDLHPNADEEQRHDHEREFRSAKALAARVANELDDISRACKVMGYSRQQFYEICRNFRTYGA